MKESLSLRPHVPALVGEAWPDAVADVVDDTGLRPRTFPAACPFTLEQILDRDYVPEDDG